MRSRWVWAATIAVAIAAAVVSGIALVHTVGLQYDEALFIPAAIDRDTTQFVQMRWEGVPVLLMLYIGALKSWAYMPIFELFGVSLDTIRIPMILLFATSIAIAARLVWVRVTPWAAALATALLVTEPAFTLMSRNDWGPVMISGFFRVVLIVALVSLVTTRHGRWIVLVVVVMALGIFNKLDFAIGALAILAASGVAFAPQWLAFARARLRLVIGGLVALVTVLGLAGLLLYLPARGAATSFAGTWAERLSQRVHLVQTTFDGELLAAYMLRAVLPVASWAIPLALASAALVAVVAFVVFLVSREGRAAAPHASVVDVSVQIGAGRLTAFFILASVLTFAGLFVVGEVTGPHHVAALWPFPWLAMATGIAYLVSVLRRRALPTPVAVGAVSVGVALLVVVVGTQIASSVSIAQALVRDNARPPIWTMDTESAADVIDALGPDAGPVVIGDWGIANQLVAFDDRSPEGQYLDIWPDVVSAPPADALAAAGLTGRFVLAYHDDDSQIVAGSTSGALAIITECVSRGGNSVIAYRGDDVIVRVVTCPAP